MFIRPNGDLFGELIKIKKNLRRNGVKWEIITILKDAELKKNKNSAIKIRIK